MIPIITYIKLPIQAYKVSLVSGTSSTYFVDVDGPANVASFNYPSGVAQDTLGIRYIADTNNNKIRKIDPDGQVTTFAGSVEPGLVDGIGTNARFNGPTGLTVDASGVLFVVDVINNAIRKITPDGQVTTVVGSTANLQFLYG